MCKAQIVGVELLGEMNELTTVAQILKQHDVLCIQYDVLFIQTELVVLMCLFLLKKFCTLKIARTFL